MDSLRLMQRIASFNMEISKLVEIRVSRDTSSVLAKNMMGFSLAFFILSMSLKDQFFVNLQECNFGFRS